jgi:hypothetical protein
MQKPLEEAAVFPGLTQALAEEFAGGCPINGSNSDFFRSLFFQTLP